MKKIYKKPTFSVVTLQLSHIICTSVIGPGEDNAQPGAREFNDLFDEEDVMSSEFIDFNNI
jgi:hypothetical protein